MIFLTPTLSPAQSSIERRQQYLQDTLRINDPKSHRHSISRRVTLQDNTWADWQKRTGELPPDWSEMRSYPHLPEPLEREVDGELMPITTRNEWTAEREKIKKNFQHYIGGTVPPAPETFESSILDDYTSDGVRYQMVEMRFGPENKARMTFELMIPEIDGPLPVYMTQWNHRGWAGLAVRRGYIGCVYAGADSNDDTQAYQELYPDYDFTGLMRRAWGTARVVDYLLTRPEVKHDQIAVTGHSRNGKLSLWAAAFDDRIAACVSSSCGTGGITPWRMSDPQYANQTLDDIMANASHWFHPRLRFFFGHEDKLPVDQNELLALIAPRALLLHYATVERQLNPWVCEQSYESAKTVYDFLGVSDKIALFPRMGEHAVAARDLERCIDFLDMQFGRQPLAWTSERLYDFSFDEWAVANADARTSAAGMTPVLLKDDYATTAAFEQDKAAALDRLDWLLGDTPPGVQPLEIGKGSPGNVDWIYDITGKPQPKNAEMIQMSPYATIGDYLQPTFYLPLDKDGKRRLNENGKVPVVIYLHSYSYAHGFIIGDRPVGGGNGSRDIFQALLDDGYAVMAFDMYGFGTRQHETQHFDKRYPGWSRMGKMVEDVSNCIDAMHLLDYVDTENIYALGNTIGGGVAAMAAAKDARLRGIAMIAGFSPWRANNEQYISLQNYADHHMFIPRLGFFADAPESTPVDFGEILATIAPRPLLVIAPTLDRHSDPEAVSSEMDKVAGVYNVHGAADHLQFETPREINRVTPEMMETVTEFFGKIKK